MESSFLLNHDINNTSALNKATPFGGNVPACDIEKPGGENYNAGRYYSPLTNEVYWLTYNSNNAHYLSRINGNGDCEIVYSGNCLDLSADPRHEVTTWRMHMKYERLCSNRHGKYLCFIDGRDVPIFYIDTEASILTNNFTTPFFDFCPDPCAPLQLCVPNPDGCLKAEFIPFTLADSGLSNFIIDRGFKFMYKYVYYDDRESEWSDRSTLYFQDTKGCFDSSEGFSRCMKFRIPIGNPLVDRIKFAFSDNGGVTWFLYETIEKYKKYNSSQEYWYERSLSENVSSSFSEEDCAFDYIFCNDKGRIPIDTLEISRLSNPMPRAPQALLPMPKETLGFLNYLKGFCPIDKSEIDKVTIDLNCTDTSICDTEFAEIKVRAIIHNTTHDRNQFVYREGSGVDDDISDTAKFGGLNPSLDGGYEDPIPYDQSFDGKVRNFIIGIEGTDYWAEMKQWTSTRNWEDRKFHGIVNDMGEESTRNKWRKDQRHGYFLYEEGILKVPKGTKGFLRMFSHHAQGNEQNTSTFVLGIYDDLHNYRGNDSLGVHINYQSEEIYFDTCNGDVDISSAFVIQDNAVDTGIVDDSIHPQASAMFGYLKDNDGKPIEGALVVPYHENTEYDDRTSITDHNGFFHTYTNGTPFENGLDFNISVHFKVELNCGDFATVKSSTGLSEKGTNTDIGIVRITNDDNAAYTDGSYAEVRVKVEDCDAVGVSGIRVALSGSKYDVTGADGFAVFKIRNYSTRARSVRAVIADQNGCFTLDCSGNCNPCFDTPTSNTPVCYAEPNQQRPVVTLPTITINKNSSITNRKGLKNGGRYQFAVMVEGDCGLLSAAYPLKINDGYINIPKAQESGQVRYCDFIFNGNGIKLPAGAKRLKILRGVNVNPFELQWVVDKIEKTDSGKIKLTIQSLNDYNAQYFFKTNTIYQYQQGDRIEFIKNGDGDFFDTGIHGVLNYLTLSPFNDENLSGVDSDDDANFFNQLLINDDGKLDVLTEGAIIELQRPRASTENSPFFEICVSAQLTLSSDGTYSELSIGTFTFNTFDTYLVSRTVGRFPAQLFEHHSPSDFWGITRIDETVHFLTDIGKIHFANTYENERRFERNITVNSANIFNYFGDFEKTFAAPEHGGIVAISLKDEKIGLAIGERDNFLFQVGDDLLRVGADNVVRAVSADQLISNPQAKLSGEYGCSYQDIGSIFFGDGYATYIDQRNNDYIIHDYSLAKKAGVGIAKDGIIFSQCSSFFKKRIREKENFNKTATNFLDHLRYSTGIDKETGRLFLTTKSWRHAGINNEKEKYLAPNDTITYHPETDTYLTFAGFTPEGYSTLNLNTAGGCAFITFQNSLPYIHEIYPTVYNKFYGINNDWVVGITLNAQNKILVPLSVEQQTDIPFFAHSVTTDKTNFRSEIPIVKIKSEQLNKWNCHFLGNSNSRTGLYGDEGARGYWVNVIWVRDNAINTDYGTIDNAKRERYSELDSILVKFFVSEQSGFSENL